jgi:hypothetical protein
MSEEGRKDGSEVREEDDALARLAAEGQGKIREAAASKEGSRQATHDWINDRLLRGGLGAYFGTTVRTVGKALAGVAVVFGLGIMFAAGWAPHGSCPLSGCWS